MAQQIQNMSSSSCSIILGLFTSRDCLIAGPFLKKNKIIGVSPSCSDDKEDVFFPYLYTAVPSLDTFSTKMANYLKQRKDLGLIFAVYEPSDIYSMTGFNQFRTIFNKPLIQIPLGLEGKFDISQFSYDKETPVTIIFFTYPLPSAQMLTKLSDHQLISKNVKIIGSASWVFDVSVFKPIKPILEKAQEVMAVDILDWNKMKNSNFNKKFKDKFRRTPLTIEILNYDTTQFSIECYKKSLINNRFNISVFRDCLTKNVYHGVSGAFSFNKKSPFADRELYLTNFIDRI